MKLHYTPGSPFARVIRVLLRELDIECEKAEVIGFPPSAAFFAVNPLGQVPAMHCDDGVRFPTRIIIDYVLLLPRGTQAAPFAEAVRRTAACRDEQTLAVLLAMGDALAAIKYQHWAGLGAVGENLIGYDPAERHGDRVQRTLDWLEVRATPNGFLPEVLSVQDVVLSCLILWSEARGSIAWRGRRKLEAIVARCAVRRSFGATEPQPWP